MPTPRQLNLIIWICVVVQVACTVLTVFVLSYGTTLHKVVQIFGGVPIFVMLWAIITLNKARSGK
jgi:hypothetical protein